MMYVMFTYILNIHNAPTYYAHPHICIHACTCYACAKHIQVYMHTCAHMCTRTHTCANAHSQTHILTLTNTHIHKHQCRALLGKFYMLSDEAMMS